MFRAKFQALGQECRLEVSGLRGHARSNFLWGADGTLFRFQVPTETLSGPVWDTKIGELVAPFSVYKTSCDVILY